ncbi:MAG TPA: ABC transporter ATP-binding protein [Bacillota bacterium]|nr:ABC transporter ATP-binding protein [Bacillota bacterium]
MEINNVSFAYQDGLKRLKNIRGFIKQGEITTIIGPNGSGKSTLLGVLTKHLQPQSGVVTLDDKLLTTYSLKGLAKKMAVVHQQNDVPSEMTVENLVYYGRLPYKRSFSAYTEEDRSIVEWALTSTGLLSRKNDIVSQLSGGQQQRVWIAMALAQKTPYLFLDEPTANLDVFYQYDLLKLVKQLNKSYGLTVVMVLHDMTQAIQFSNQLIAMKDGEVVDAGRPEKVMTEETIEEIYGIKAVVKKDEKLGMYIIPVHTM